MTSRIRELGMALLLATAAIGPATEARASERFAATLGASVDDAGGNGFDVDGWWSPTDWLTLGAGAGRSRSSDELADLQGTSLRASASARGSRFGARLSWRSWDDDERFQSRTVGGELSVALGDDWTLAALAEQRRLEVGYELFVGPRAFPQTASFTGRGYGLELCWSDGTWSGYARGIGYDYDAALERWIALSRTPNLSRLPRIEALTRSVLTGTAGALDRELALGIDRAFPRWGVAFDLSLARDAVSEADTRSLSVTLRRAVSPRVDADVSLGLSDSDDAGSLAFAAVAFTLR